MDLFKLLDTKPEDGNPYTGENLAAFPYVDGGLSTDENIVIPRVDERIIDRIPRKVSEEFDWSAIGPKIFGAYLYQMPSEVFTASDFTH